MTYEELCYMAADAAAKHGFGPRTVYLLQASKEALDFCFNGTVRSVNTPCGVVMLQYYSGGELEANLFALVGEIKLAKEPTDGKEN